MQRLHALVAPTVSLAADSSERLPPAVQYIAKWVCVRVVRSRGNGETGIRVYGRSAASVGTRRTSVALRYRTLRRIMPEWQSGKVPTRAHTQMRIALPPLGPRSSPLAIRSGSRGALAEPRELIALGSTVSGDTYETEARASLPSDRHGLGSSRTYLLTGGSALVAFLPSTVPRDFRKIGLLKI